MTLTLEPSRTPRMLSALRGVRYRPVLTVLLLPSLLLIGVFSYYPAVRSLIGGFYQWNGFSPPTYAGLSQFKEYVQSATFGTEAKNLALLVVGSVLITLVSQFTAAEIVSHLPRRASSVAKYLLVLPIVLPPLVLIEVWAYLFQPGSGLIDKVFSAVGLPQSTWLADPHVALASILLASRISLGRFCSPPRKIRNPRLEIHGKPISSRLASTRWGSLSQVG